MPWVLRALLRALSMVRALAQALRRLVLTALAWASWELPKVR
jgi:hypothetical protein